MWRQHLKEGGGGRGGEGGGKGEEGAKGRVESTYVQRDNGCMYVYKLCMHCMSILC